MKKNKNIKTIIISLFFFGILLNSCGSLNNYYIPDPNIAEDPPGLLINPENYAFIGGKIRAINQYDFNPFVGAIREYPTRTLRVPVGETLAVLVHYNMRSSTTEYYGFRLVSLPPLENGGSYVLYLNNPPFGPSSFRDSHIIFLKLNQNSGGYESVPGATFLN